MGGRLGIKQGFWSGGLSQRQLTPKAMPWRQILFDSSLALLQICFSSLTDPLSQCLDKSIQNSNSPQGRLLFQWWWAPIAAPMFTGKFPLISYFGPFGFLNNIYHLSPTNWSSLSLSLSLHFHSPSPSLNSPSPSLSSPSPSLNSPSPSLNSPSPSLNSPSPSLNSPSSSLSYDLMWQVESHYQLRQHEAVFWPTRLVIFLLRWWWWRKQDW